MEQELLVDTAVFVVRELLSPEECRAFIEEAEAEGFDDAPITTAFGFQHQPDVRNNTRVMMDREDWAEALWERVRELDLPELAGVTPIGLNERFRFYRYDPGQRFAPHYDGCFARSRGERSLYTVLIYLNDAVEGGETILHEHGLEVAPETGLGLFFLHEQLHEGAEVLQGRKYVLRTDLMYDISP